MKCNIDRIQKIIFNYPHTFIISDMGKILLPVIVSLVILGTFGIALAAEQIDQSFTGPFDRYNGLISGLKSSNSVKFLSSIV